MAFAFEPATIALLVVMGSSCGIMSQFTTEVILTRGSDVFGIFSRKKHSLNTCSTLFPHGQPRLGFVSMRIMKFRGI